MGGFLLFALLCALIAGACWLVFTSVVSIASITLGQMIVYLLFIAIGYVARVLQEP